ncbi:MAG TPA: N-acetylmuramic acid 6-phosphate etherase [Lachnoclostridium phytofermentans]|uniref:N-acetylmuramic acid 6-phosphate etherase n=1 Tax=Lachnoclostridium phytofermentans TaxID=66219 RepID=A0A3D2XBC6_9FIRM|nr:N-acetylmuramic acid 6-phosphate etherase [Lachnoclostridium sp.]HCL04439.1 N-acetylmuramic acid 6-phosphate etherase [Lachnoclostridium phytofermentans]
MNEYLMNLITEQVNQTTKDIDELSTTQILELINKEDSKVTVAVEKEISQIAKAVDIITVSLGNGGKMIYFGAGTSGRLGILDASECPPTYGTDPALIQAYIAGGDIAIRTAVEGSEDIEEDGRNQALECHITKGDVVVGITASGSAAYVIGALKQAKELGATVIGVVNNRNTKLDPICDVCIAPVTGPEVIVGSTRMKAGTAQKMVLNMLTTAAMIKLGKVYGNMMVDLNASNVKLIDRAIRIVKTVTGVNDATAKEFLEKSNYKSKLAIMMIQSGYTVEESKRILKDNNGYLKQALSK